MAELKIELNNDKKYIMGVKAPERVTSDFQNPNIGVLVFDDTNLSTAKEQSTGADILEDLGITMFAINKAEIKSAQLDGKKLYSSKLDQLSEMLTAEGYKPEMVKTVLEMVKTIY